MNKGPTESAFQLAQMIRDRKIVDYRRSGMTYDQIQAAMADENEPVSRGTISSVCRAGLTRAAAELDESVETFRAEQLERLQALLHASWEWAMGGSPRHLDAARRIIGDMSDLMGVKAPVRHEFGESDVDRLLREALAEINQRAASAGDEAADVQAGTEQSGAAG